MELILVTGFLGSGKTTLLRRLVSLYPEKRVHLIVNEFGSVNVDGALLRDSGASLAEITGGSIFCACRLDQFEEALDIAQAAGPDRIIVEASGLSDPTAIRSLLEQSGRYPGIRFRGSIALVDATRLLKVVQTARVCAKQLSVADLFAVTKTDIAPPETAQAVFEFLESRYPGVPALEVVQGNLPQEAVEALTPLRPALDALNGRDLTLQKLVIQVSESMTSEQLRAFLRMFAEDACRVKGFAALRDGVFLADCVGSYVCLTPRPDAQADNRLAALATEGMPMRRSIQAAVRWFEGLAWLAKE